MLKKVLIGVGILIVVALAGVFVFARSILATDTVRMALASQVSAAIGQPVSIASISAAIYPRITVNLDDVRIGEPARIRAQTLSVGTDFRAILSRRIEHASLRLDGAHIELPLPPLAIGGTPATPGASPASAPSAPPVEIVSIDEIVLRDVEIVSGGHTLRADVEAAPQGKGIALRRVSVRADETELDASGQVTDLAGPVGELSIKAGALNFDRLLKFFSDFSGGSGMTGGTQGASTTAPAAARPKPAAAGSGMNLVVSIDATRATIGSMALDKLSGRARITDQNVTIEPISFGLFHGRYEGTMVLGLGDTPDFHLKAALSGVDVAEAMTFAGSPNTITGKLAGRIDLTGRGTAAPAVMRTARGTVRVNVRDGVVKNLGLLRAVVVATSMKADAKQQLSSGSKEEPFSSLGATLRIANGTATTDDLRFESKDLSLAAAGSTGLNGSAVDLKGKIQLSEGLSQQAGSELVRYTQEQGRVTLPATVTGSADNLSARIDVKDVAQRAIKNRANEEGQKLLKKGLGGLFK